MDKQWLEFILKDIKKDIIDAKVELKLEIGNIKKDVREVLEFKWKLYGMSIVCGIIGAGATKIILMLVG